ncbi:MAG: hypothetical protein NT072_10915 [Deltaproteobacteria bacterium]|nr:hypothetical protein [Deltaproteobacteria bacterium]
MSSARLKEKVLIAAVMIFVAMLPVAAFAQAAQGEPKLTLTMDVKKEVKVKKGTVETVEYVPAKTTAPDDVLLYTITYKNEGKTELKDAAIMDAVPDGTVYILESAGGKDTEAVFSIDGGKTFQKPPITYMVKNSDGTIVRKPAPAEMYTHVQWIVKKFVLPGESGIVNFKVKVK